MDIYGESNLGGELQDSKLEVVETTAEDLEYGTWAFIEKRLSILVEVEGIPVWLPLTPETNTFPYEQPVEDTEWNIPHNFDKDDVIVQCFDDLGKHVVPSSIQAIDKNTTRVIFDTPLKGKAIAMFGNTIGHAVEGTFKGGLSSVPVGTVFRIYRTAMLPENCLPLMGQTVSREYFPELVKVLAGENAETVTLDDVRGKFLRNLDYGRGKDADRAEGSEQSEMIGLHDHTASIANKNLGTKTSNTKGNHYHGSPFGERSSNARYGVYDTSLGWGSRSGMDTDNFSYKTSTNGNHKHTLALGSHNHGLTVNEAGGSEVRPKNIAYLTVIKAK